MPGPRQCDAEVPCESGSIHQCTDIDGPGPTPRHQLFGLHITPQPTQGTLAGRQQTAFLPGAPIAIGLSNLSSGATTTPGGSTSANPNAHSDPDAMDTTSPSRAVIFQAPQGPRRTICHFTRHFQVLATHHPVAALPWPTALPIYLKSQPASRPPVLSTLTQESPLSPQLDVTVGNRLTIPTC